MQRQEMDHPTTKSCDLNTFKYHSNYPAVYHEKFKGPTVHQLSIQKQFSTEVMPLGRKYY